MKKVQIMYSLVGTRVDAITFGTGSFTGASTGNLTITPELINTGAVTVRMQQTVVVLQGMFINQLLHLQVQTVQLVTYGFYTLN